MLSATNSVEELEKGDREGGGTEAVGDEDAAEVFVEAQFEVFQACIQIKGLKEMAPVG